MKKNHTYGAIDIPNAFTFSLGSYLISTRNSNFQIFAKKIPCGEFWPLTFPHDIKKKFLLRNITFENQYQETLKKERFFKKKISSPWKISGEEGMKDKERINLGTLW